MILMTQTQTHLSQKYTEEMKKTKRELQELKLKKERQQQQQQHQPQQQHQQQQQQQQHQHHPHQHQQPLQQFMDLDLNLDLDPTEDFPDLSDLKPLASRPTTPQTFFAGTLTPKKKRSVPSHSVSFPSFPFHTERTPSFVSFPSLFVPPPSRNDTERTQSDLF
jgi:hypothetical protein